MRSIPVYHPTDQWNDYSAQPRYERRQYGADKSARLQYPPTFFPGSLLRRRLAQEPFVTTQGFHLFESERNSAFQQISNALAHAIDEWPAAGL
jgi:hypothetical protein